jgi:hypothetical protein
MCPYNKLYLQQTNQINTLDDYNDIIEHEITFTSEPVAIQQITTHRIARNIEFLESHVNGENVNKDISSPDYARHIIGKRDVHCRYCNALMWKEEKLVNSSSNKPIFSTCCNSGKIVLDKQIKLPDFLKNLLISNDTIGKKFRSAIRLYNSILSFASVSANIDEKLMPANQGVYTYRINGRIHHKLSSMLPRDNNQPKFSQIYIYDSEMQTAIRSGMFPQSINIEILNQIQNLLIQFNPYVKIYKQAGELLREKPSIALNIIIKSNKTKDKTLNAPTSNEIAVLMVNSEEENQSTSRDVVVKLKTESQYDTVFLNENVSYYDPLAYPLMFLNGEAGWQYSTYPKRTTAEIKQFDLSLKNQKDYLINQHNLIQPASSDDVIVEDENENQEDQQLNDQINELGDNETNKKYVTAREYYSYTFQDRNGNLLYYTKF